MSKLHAKRRTIGRKNEEEEKGGENTHPDSHTLEQV